MASFFEIPAGLMGLGLEASLKKMEKQAVHAIDRKATTALQRVSAGSIWPVTIIDTSKFLYNSVSSYFLSLALLVFFLNTSLSVLKYHGSILWLMRKNSTKKTIGLR